MWSHCELRNIACQVETERQRERKIEKERKRERERMKLQYVSATKGFQATAD